MKHRAVLMLAIFVVGLLGFITLAVRSAVAATNSTWGALKVKYLEIAGDQTDGGTNTNAPPSNTNTPPDPPTK